MTICEIATAAGVIGAMWYACKTVVPEEFKERAAKYAKIKKEDITEIGAMAVMDMRHYSRRANSEFFRRTRGVLTGRHVVEYHRTDSFFSPLSLPEERRGRQDYLSQHRG